MADSPDTSEIAAGLGTKVIGRNVRRYPVVASTMKVARELARQGAPEGTAVIADRQTAGRGRLGRTWLSPEGSLALSVLLYPDLAELPSLIMLASLAVGDAIRNVTGLDSQIKWPNDILIGGHKVCGMLIETRFRQVRRNEVHYAVIGIGVNVNVPAAALAEVRPPPTSLSAELGRPVSIVEATRSLLREMDRRYLELRSGGSLFEAWRGRLVTLGRRVRVTSGETSFEGIAESVERDGRLSVRTTDGHLTSVVAGDVTLKE
jgi:BirA family biotin operon repressor/biotin-[acetyl-CoA-carboxylase] ligase